MQQNLTDDWKYLCDAGMLVTLYNLNFLVNIWHKV
jgi:hypothetical protein